ncbi:MAG: methionyl-tRNA formyltransferase [Microbacterium sp.]|uniref:methionyl-tRNA formyltransferase n=1 Tax=Microbacterium sp. TaxID=51671 RepID=UPI003A8B8BBD
MRLVFAGTPDAAVPSLRLLAQEGHDIALVVTRPDAPLGRKRVLTPSPVGRAAEELGLPVLKAARLDDAATAAIMQTAPDLGVIVAYGGLVREPLLSTPAHGWINLHFSLLPRWRGAAPVQRAIIAGDRQTGTAVFQLVAGLDAGAVFAQSAHDIPPEATAGTLLEELAGSGARQLSGVVADIASGRARAHPQSGEPTYAPKLTLDDARLRWTGPADAVLARLRGVTPEPGAFTTLDGARVKVLRARHAERDGPALAPGELVSVGRDVLVGTGTTPLVLETVQPAGKGAMAAADWRRGLRADIVRVGT